MIHDIDYTGSHGQEHRLLAVVSGQAEREGEVRAQFAAQGEDVETRWYASPTELLAQADAEEFSAVILFTERDPRATDADEVTLRGRLTHTPLFRVAA